MKVGALIPARIGSKRVPKKNIRKLYGKPLLFWSIDAALEADCFDDVTISTESDTITDLVRSAYSEREVRILRRPENLATDSAPMHAVANHYLSVRPELHHFGTFLPTYPFRKPQVLQRIHRQLCTGEVLRVISSTNDQHSSRDMYYPVEEGVRPFFRPPTVFANKMSACYSFSHRDWIDPIGRRYGFTVNEHCLTIALSMEEDVDIDTLEDFALAESVAAGARPETRKSVLHETSQARILLPEGVAVDAFVKYIQTRIPDWSGPVLCLETPAKPSFMFMISNADPKAYYHSREAFEHYKPSAKILKTTCNSHQQQHHVQSIHYRVLPKSFAFKPYPLETPRTTPKNDAPHTDHETVPWSRVIHMEDLRQQPFYIDPIALRPPQGSSRAHTVRHEHTLLDRQPIPA